MWPYPQETLFEMKNFIFCAVDGKLFRRKIDSYPNIYTFVKNSANGSSNIMLMWEIHDSFKKNWMPIFEH